MSGKSITEIGICGKIPSRGDFITQGLAADFVDAWNEWLQAVLAVSREQLGADWLDIYLTSPIWHFAISPGVCGSEGKMGCLMPSVDQVGRHYPFTVSRSLACTPVQARLQSGWAEVLEQQVLHTLEDDFVLEPWLSALKMAEFNWPQAVKVSCPVMSASQGRPAWVLRSEEQPDAASLLHHSYRQQFGRYCLWWTAGSEHVEPCTLVTSGLPQVGQFAAMLNGDWQRWQWQLADINSNGSSL